MIKTFKHAVICNGKLYPANTPIEVAEKSKSAKVVDKPAKKAGGKNDTTAD